MSMGCPHAGVSLTHIAVGVEQSSAVTMRYNPAMTASSVRYSVACKAEPVLVQL